jgi:hypothetical protein
MTTFGKVFFIFILCAHAAWATLMVPNLPNKGVADPDNNNFIDPEVDYEIFTGRISDKDDSGTIFKVKVENNNTKFFRAGDKIKFTVAQHEADRECLAYVRSNEDFHFVITVENLSACFSDDIYLKRGTILNFKAPILSQRILEASKYREILILKKDGFLKQLNDINHFVWSFDQQKVKTAAEYDEKILAMQKEKQRAIDELIRKKQEYLVLQNELMGRLNSIDESLNYYKIDRHEYITDRWNMDHDMSLPFPQRPQKMKKP